MALPILAALVGTARIAYPIIAAGVRRGITSRSIAASLKVADLGIRRSTLLQIMKREKEIWQHGLNLKFLNFNQKPNPLKLPRAIHQIRRKYSYVISVLGRDGNSGLDRKQNITVSSSKLLTRGEAESLAGSMAADRFDSGQMEVMSTQLINVLQSGEFGTLT